MMWQSFPDPSEPRILHSFEGSAGDLNRLYLAVMSAWLLHRDNPEWLKEEFIRYYKAFREYKGGDERGRKRGLKSPRSAEPHLNLARELNLIERERWYVTPLGKAFLFLSFPENSSYPAHTILSLLLYYDRDMLQPLSVHLPGWMKDGIHAHGEITPRIREIWRELWGRYGNALNEISRLPKEEEIGGRTCIHWVAARLRLLGSEGLNLKPEQLCTLQRLLQGDGEEPFVMAFHVIKGREPRRLSRQELRTRINWICTHSRDDCGFGYLKFPVPVLDGEFASGRMVFICLNEMLAAEGTVVSEQAFREVLGNFRTCTSFGGDLLLAPQDEIRGCSSSI